MKEKTFWVIFGLYWVFVILSFAQFYDNLNGWVFWGMMTVSIAFWDLLTMFALSYLNTKNPNLFPNRVQVAIFRFESFMQTLKKE